MKHNQLTQLPKTKVKQDLPKPIPRVQTVNISFDSKLLEAFDIFASITRRTRSEVIRMAMEYYLYTHYPEKPFYMHECFKKKAKS